MADEATAQANAEVTTVKNSLVSYDKETMLNIYTKIEKFRLDVGSTSDKETINVLNNYRWTLHKAIAPAAGGAGGQIPFAFVKEYKQLYSSQITNTINSLMALHTVDTKALTEEAGNLYKSVSNIVKSLAAAAKA